MGSIYVAFALCCKLATNNTIIDQIGETFFMMFDTKTSTLFIDNVDVVVLYYVIRY